MSSSRDIVIYLYNGMTALDAIGPYEVLRCATGVQIRFAARRPGLVKTDSGIEMHNAEYGIAEIDTTDVLVVPGGDASTQINDQEVLQWVRRMHATTKWTAIAASVRWPRWTGWVYAVTTTGFVLSNFLLPVGQSITSALLFIATLVVAWSAGREAQRQSERTGIAPTD